MKKAILATLVLLTAVAALPAPASADLRNPQVVLSNGGFNLDLQLDALDAGNINVNTAQEDLQRWSRNITGSGAFTLAIELGGDPSNNCIGVYNSVADDGVPVGALFEIFPASAEQGWYAVAQFNLDQTLDVRLFNSLDEQQGDVTHYDDVNVSNFSFYIKNGSNIGFGQDALNDGDQARALVFAGTGANNGGWFLCFEAGVDPAIAIGNNATVDPEGHDFDEAILFLEAIRPVPVARSTWASLKARFR